MRLHLDDITEEPLIVEIDESVKAFKGLTALEHEGVRFLAPVQGTVSLCRQGAMIELKGQLKTRLELQCSRCLATFDDPFTVQVALTLNLDKPSLDDEEEERELDAEELETWDLEGDEVELMSPLEEQLLLALPVQPLCQEECKGLCPSCGADLNKNECDCKGTGFPGPFDALKDLKLDE